MMRRLRVFISSPGDVRSAREIGALTIERIARDYARWFDVQPYLWESEPVLASRHFQDSLELPSSFDVVVMILWSRLGTVLPDRTPVREYRGMDGRSPVTGTEWEFEEALQASERSGTPDLLVYRCLKDATFDLGDPQRREQQLTQLRSLDRFWARHFSVGKAMGHTTYMTDAEFAASLEGALRKLIEKRIATFKHARENAGGKPWNSEPFRGLESYEFEHAPIYFGQDESLTKAMMQLTSDEKGRLPFLIVLGASGSGKSSLVKAGLVPKLFVERRIPGAAFIRRVVMRPSDALEDEDIFSAFTRRLVNGVSDAEGLPELLGPGQTVMALASHFRNSTSDPAYPIGTALGQITVACRQSGRLLEFETARLVLVIDQLEELYTNDRFSSDERRRFIQLIAGLLKSGFVWVIATMRKDFWHRADETPELVHLSEDSARLELLPPTPVQLSQMIRRPAEAAGISFETHPSSGVSLNEIIAEEVSRESGALPLLSYLMDQLYRADVLEKGGGVLTYDTYERLGGLEGAIATKAESVLARCAPDVRQTLGSLLFSLIQLGVADGAVDRAVARRVPLSTFPQATPRRMLVEAFLHSDARLLVTDADSGSVATIRVAHEALITRWALARQFVETHASSLKVRRRIEERYAIWRNLNERYGDRRNAGGFWNLAKFFEDRLRAESGLLSDIDVTDAKRLLKDHLSDVEPELVAYMQRSILHEQRRRSRSLRVVSGVAALVAVLAIFALVASFTASRRRREAEFQTLQTLEAQQRLLTEVASNRLKEGDVAGAQGIVVEVLTSGEKNQYAGNALDVFQKVRAADPTVAILLGHSDFLETATYSPDGLHILTSSRDKTARIWNAATGAFERLLGEHKDMVLTAAYSPDGEHIVTASADNTARIWDARTGRLEKSLTGHTNWVRSAAYSRDGSKIVTASYDRSASIWDSSLGTHLLTLSGHADIVEWAEFSPDDTHVVTASLDKTARIWDARSGRLLKTLSGHGERVATASYSPDGAWIVTSSFDKTARVWDAKTGEPISVLIGHTERLESAVYSPDGKRILTAAADNTARVWEARTGAQLGILQGHSELLISAAYSPDGQRIVTASYDRTARVWDALTSAPLVTFGGHNSGVMEASYSPDGNRIVTAGRDAAARIWNAASGEPLTMLKGGHADIMNSARFSPDGKDVVTASFDRTARIWDAGTGQSKLALIGHADVLHAAKYSANGRYLLTNSLDNSVRIWDARTGAIVRILPSQAGAMHFAAFSPDATRVASIATERLVRIWDAGSGQQKTVLAGHENTINSASFSGDGREIVTASDDMTVRVWNAQTGVQLDVFSGFGKAVSAAEFSADGSQITTISADNVVRILDAKTGMPLAELPAAEDSIASAVFSPDGSRVLVASAGMAGTWAAPVPAPLDVQIWWTNAAEFDPLTEVQRNQLGIRRDSRVRLWTDASSACDVATAAYYDPNRLAIGVTTAAIIPQMAIAACAGNISRSSSPRTIYQAGRAYLVGGESAKARALFEQANSAGYSAAKIDLAALLLNPLSDRSDVQRSLALYGEAWRAGVSEAAIRLAKLYENGLPGDGPDSGTIMAPDSRKSAYWLQLGGAARQPDCMARLAALKEVAAADADEKSSHRILMEAFALYATAAELARIQGWPDDIWKPWRYRRATLARVLAHAGMMREVADTFRMSTTLGMKSQPALQ